MAKLILSLENTFLSEYLIDKERITIGRRPTNDIHIDNLAVSGEHAAILKIGNDFYVEDLGSTNGTLLNAKGIKKHLLQHADLIEFGKHQLKYIDEAVLSNAGMGGGETDLKKTVITRPSGMKAMEPESVHAPAASPAATQQMAASIDSLTSAAVSPAVNLTARIQVLNGSNSGRELLLNKALTTLGKIGVQVAVITKRPHGYYITHVEGKVFPIVNGSSTGVQAFALSDYDVIELAGVKMEFYLDKT